MLDLVVIGHISLDTTESDFGEMTTPGGAALLTAGPASIFSKKVAIISRVGGDFPLQELRAWNDLDISAVKVFSNEPTARFYHRYLTKDHSVRKWLPQFGVGAQVCREDIPLGLLKTRFFHVATMPPQQQLPIIQFLRQNSCAFISADTLENFIEKYPHEVSQVATMTDIMCIDRSERSLQKVLKGKDFLLKMGREGAMLYYKGQKYQAKTKPVDKVVDKTGAGDVLTGVLFANWAVDSNIQKALELGTKVATASIMEFGIAHLREKFGKANHCEC